MTNYSIKQRFDISTTPTAIFNEKYDDINASICIAQQDGQMGMVMANGEIILPFAYDNISLMGNELYLLIKGGKQGILHAKPVYENDDITIDIMMKTDCVYDYISGRSRFQKSFVALRRDLPQTFTYEIYFVETGILLVECWKVDYMDEDYVVVTDFDHRTKKCFDRYGQFVFAVPAREDCAVIVFDPFETTSGTVFVLLQLDYFEMVFVERNKKQEFQQRVDDNPYFYECSGQTKHIFVDEFLYPILASERFRTFDRDCALAFMVKHRGKTFLLDGRCERADDAYEKYCLSCKQKFYLL